MSEPRTVQPLQFFHDVGDAVARGVVTDFRPNVTKGDPLGEYPTVDDEPELIKVVPDEPNEPARPPMDADDAPDPDESIEEDDEDQGSVDDLLTSTDDEESIAADGPPSGG